MQTKRIIGAAAAALGRVLIAICRTGSSSARPDPHALAEGVVMPVLRMQPDAAWYRRSRTGKPLRY